MEWIKQLVYGLWVWECLGMWYGTTFIHGIVLEILLTSMWPLAVISVRRKYVIPRELS